MKVDKINKRSFFMKINKMSKANDSKLSRYDEFSSNTQRKCSTDMLLIGNHQCLKFGWKHWISSCMVILVTENELPHNFIAIIFIMLYGEFLCHQIVYVRKFSKEYVNTL